MLFVHSKFLKNLGICESRVKVIFLRTKKKQIRSEWISIVTLFACDWTQSTSKNHIFTFFFLPIPLRKAQTNNVHGAFSPWFTLLRKHSFGFYLQGRLPTEYSEFRWIKESLCPPQRADPLAICSGAPVGGAVRTVGWDPEWNENTADASASPGAACGEEPPAQLGSTDGIGSDKASDSPGSVANEGCVNTD